MAKSVNSRELRERLEKRVGERKTAVRGVFLFVNLFMFILFNIIAWSMYSQNVVGIGNVSDLIGALVMLDAGWFCALLFQAISLFFDTKAGENSIRNQIIMREFGTDLLRMVEEQTGAEEEKPKRAMELTDDGELEEVAGDILLTEDEARQHRRGG